MKAKTLHEVITSMMEDNSNVQRRLYKAIEDKKDGKTLAIYNKVLDQVCAAYNAMLEADTELRRHLNLL